MTATNKKPTQFELFKLLYLPPLETDTIGACAFMRLVDELHTQYVVPLQQEVEAKLASRFERGWRKAYTFADGVMVKSIFELAIENVASVFVRAVGEERVIVCVVDNRFRDSGLGSGSVVRRFEQELIVPHEFHALLCEKRGKRGMRDLSVREWTNPATLKRHVKMMLAKREGVLLHSFDRAAKLRKLQQILAS